MIITTVEVSLADRNGLGVQSSAHVVQTEIIEIEDLAAFLAPVVKLLAALHRHNEAE